MCARGLSLARILLAAHKFENCVFDIRHFRQIVHCTTGFRGKFPISDFLSSSPAFHSNSRWRLFVLRIRTCVMNWTSLEIGNFSEWFFFNETTRVNLRPISVLWMKIRVNSRCVHSSSAFLVRVEIFGACERCFGEGRWSMFNVETWISHVTSDIFEQNYQTKLSLLLMVDRRLCSICPISNCVLAAGGVKCEKMRTALF